ncbi:hypothetical protein LCGC14_2752360, partial [marine sediment metagenome]
MDKLDTALKLGNEILNAKLQNKLADYIPYGLSPDDSSDWQLRFHSLGKIKYQRLLCAALRIGKS